MKKTILITGTSSGLGKSTAKYFAKEGWNVAATMRSPDKDLELRNIENIKVFKLDVTDISSIQSAADEAIAQFGKIDVVVNNAGAGIYGALELATEENIDQMWQINVKGIINVIRTILPHFRSVGAGMFINIGSAMGLATAMPLLSLYNMSKFALEGLTEGLFYELQPLNIDIRMVEPGGFSSELNRNLVFNRRADIDAYDNVTDKIEGILSHYDELPLGSIEEIIEIIDDLSSGRSKQFRTLAGDGAKALIEARNQTSIESFLNSNLQNFI